MEMLAGLVVDHVTWDDKLTTLNSYSDVSCHWPYSSTPSKSYWDCSCLGGKTLYFAATTNNLLVQVLGSLDGGVTFPTVVVSEFSVAVGTPVLKTISSYYNSLKVQVKPAIADSHGTLTVASCASSVPCVDINDILTTHVILADAAKRVQSHVNIDFTSAVAQTIIVAPGAGYRIRLTRLSISSGGDPQVNIEIAIKSGATTIETVKGAAMVFDYPEHRNLSTNEALVIQSTSADRIIGGVDYYVEAI